MALSFQERYRQARAAARGTPVKAKRAPAASKPKAIKPPVQQKVNIKQKVKQIVTARQQKSTSPSRERTFKKRNLDLENMIKVRIDSKTEIYIKPGADINAAIAKYKERQLYQPKKLDDDLPPKYQF